MILHHYELSPFSEKIRCMLGYCDLPWMSAISPAMPPRPIVDPLTGGYRRIPIAQVGADIFCDTRIITSEIAEISGKPELAMENCDAEINAFVQFVDGELFLAAATNGTKLKVIGLLLKNLSPWQAYRFIKDRAQVGKTSTLKRLPRHQASKLLKEHTADLEQRLSRNFFLFGKNPSIADFAAYHILQFRGKTEGLGFLADYPNLGRWLKCMKAMGQGLRTEISKIEVFAQARLHQPREIPPAMKQHRLMGALIEIKPTDYARDAVVGELVGCSDQRWVVSRNTKDFGVLHVHFPKHGYEVRQLS